MSEPAPDLSFLEQYPISAWEYPRILVGIPLERAVSYAEKVFYQFLQIAAWGPMFIKVPYGRVDIVRNNMAIQLLQTQATHLLMLDIDHIHPVNIIQQFAKWTILRPDALVISGMNFRRKTPYDPVMGNMDEGHNRPIVTEWTPGLTKYDQTGAASMLVHRSVFERMPPPWFYNVYDERVWANNSPGEDIGFCDKCRAYDIDIYVDTQITSPHCTEAVVTEASFREYMKQHPEKFRNNGNNPELAAAVQQTLR